MTTTNMDRVFYCRKDYQTASGCEEDRENEENGRWPGEGWGRWCSDWATHRVIGRHTDFSNAEHITRHTKSSSSRRERTCIHTYRQHSPQARGILQQQL